MGGPIAWRPGVALRLGGPCLSSSSNSLECSRESFRPMDSSGINGMNSGSIWQPPINNDALTSPLIDVFERGWPGPCPALDQMQVLASAPIIGFRTEIRHVDHERIAFPMAARVA